MRAVRIGRISIGTNEKLSDMELQRWQRPVYPEMLEVVMLTTEFSHYYTRHNNLKNNGFAADEKLAIARSALELSVAYYKVYTRRSVR